MSGDRAGAALHPEGIHGGAGDGRVRIGFTYADRQPSLLARLLPLVDYLEITPDSITRQRGETAEFDPAILDELRAIDESIDLVVHGVGLSIGSADGYSTRYLELVEEFVEQFPRVLWHSEHLGYTRVDGTSLGTMLAMPKTADVLELLVGRVEEIQARIPLRFMLENIVHLLPDYPGEFTDAAFLNELTSRTGCGVLLDVYNLECDAINNGFDIAAFLDELDVDTVGELHLAGGVEMGGVQVDVHSRATQTSTLELAREVVARVPAGTAVTYELLPEAIPALGDDAIVDELGRIRTALG